MSLPTLGVAGSLIAQIIKRLSKTDQSSPSYLQSSSPHFPANVAYLLVRVHTIQEEAMLENKVSIFVISTAHITPCHN
jgi:hypothetical protein